QMGDGPGAVSAQCRRGIARHHHCLSIEDPMTELTRPTRSIVNVPDGMQPNVLAQLVEQRLKDDPEARVAAVFVARDGRRLQRMEDVLRAMLPGHNILTLPAWDCLPYDRVSPNGVTIAARMTTISALADPATKGAIVLTAVN